MPKLKKRTPDLTFIKCYMCREYMDCNIINKSGERQCRISEKIIKAESIACKDFIIGEHFHCAKKSLQVSLRACYSIRKTKEIGCGTKTTSPKNYEIVYSMCLPDCKQGQDIQKLFEHLDFINGTVSFVPYLPPSKKSKLKLRKKIKLHRRKKS